MAVEEEFHLPRPTATTSKYVFHSGVKLFLKAEGRRDVKEQCCFCWGHVVFGATKLPSIFWKPVLLVFNYKTLGSTGLVGRILDAMESQAALTP